MPKSPNKRTAEVLLPGYPGGRSIRFTVDAMERLETLYPDDWLKTVNDGLDRAKPSVIIACLESSVIGEDEFNARYYAEEPGLLDDVIKAIKDGLFLTFSGKTQDELVAEQEKKRKEAMVAMGMDPEMVDQLIYLKDAGLLDSESGSIPAQSAPSAE